MSTICRSREKELLKGRGSYESVDLNMVYQDRSTGCTRSLLRPNSILRECATINQVMEDGEGNGFCEESDTPERSECPNQGQLSQD